MSLPFRLRDRGGVIDVAVAPNLDPEDLGHSLVAVGYDEDKFRGFPCVKAEIQYEGDGPRAWMGWLQVVERHDVDGTVARDVDVAGFAAEAAPLYAYGYLPTFSDFPANPHHPDGDWVAFTFLVGIPDVVRSKVLEPVVGFRWGYRLRGGRLVELFTPTELPLEAWNAHRALLESSYPSGEFRPAGTTASDQ